MIFLTETKCKIRFIYVGVNCKRKKSGVKKLFEHPLTDNVDRGDDDNNEAIAR